MIGRAATGGGALAASLCAACAEPAVMPKGPDLLSVMRAGCLDTLPGFAGAASALERIGLAPTGNDGVFDTFEAHGVSVGVNTGATRPVAGAVCVAVDLRQPPRTGWAELREAVVGAAGQPATEACDGPVTARPECTLRWRRGKDCLGLDALLRESRVFSAWLFFQRGNKGCRA